jgi:hypothetical protein
MLALGNVRREIPEFDGVIDHPKAVADWANEPPSRRN